MFDGICSLFGSRCNVCVAAILVMSRCLRSLFVLSVAYVCVLVVLLVSSVWFVMIDGLLLLCVTYCNVCVVFTLVMS